VFQGVVEDVVECLVVLLFGLDHFRPEALAEDVVLPPVAFVEGACVLSVQVAHAGGQVRERRLDEQVVVVPEQAACVEAPAVVTAHASQDLQEDTAVPVVKENRGVVVPLRRDVVVGARCDVAMRPSHVSTVTPARARQRCAARFGARE
jgi:hypothetical protein